MVKPNEAKLNSSRFEITDLLPANSSGTGRGANLGGFDVGDGSGRGNDIKVPWTQEDHENAPESEFWDNRIEEVHNQREIDDEQHGRTYTDDEDSNVKDQGSETENPNDPEDPSNPSGDDSNDSVPFNLDELQGEIDKLIKSLMGGTTRMDYANMGLRLGNLLTSIQKGLNGSTLGLDKMQKTELAQQLMNLCTSFLNNQLQVLYDRQNWTYQQIYNSPANQMQRLMEAGINPAFYYEAAGKSTADAISQSNLQSGQMSGQFSGEDTSVPYYKAGKALQLAGQAGSAMSAFGGAFSQIGAGMQGIANAGMIKEQTPYVGESMQSQIASNLGAAAAGQAQADATRQQSPSVVRKNNAEAEQAETNVQNNDLIRNKLQADAYLAKQQAYSAVRMVDLKAKEITQMWDIATLNNATQMQLEQWRIQCQKDIADMNLKFNYWSKKQDIKLGQQTNLVNAMGAVIDHLYTDAEMSCYIDAETGEVINAFDERYNNINAGYHLGGGYNSSSSQNQSQTHNDASSNSQTTSIGGNGNGGFGGSGNGGGMTSVTNTDSYGDSKTSGSSSVLGSNKLFGGGVNSGNGERASSFNSISYNGKQYYRQTYNMSAFNPYRVAQANALLQDYLHQPYADEGYSFKLLDLSARGINYMSDAQQFVIPRMAKGFATYTIDNILGTGDYTKGDEGSNFTFRMNNGGRDLSIPKLNPWNGQQEGWYHKATGGDFDGDAATWSEWSQVPKPASQVGFDKHYHGERDNR